jgi:hypothetical protein
MCRYGCTLVLPTWPTHFQKYREAWHPHQRKDMGIAVALNAAPVDVMAQQQRPAFG